MKQNNSTDEIDSQKNRRWGKLDEQPGLNPFTSWTVCVWYGLCKLVFAVDTKLVEVDGSSSFAKNISILAKTANPWKGC